MGKAHEWQRTLRCNVPLCGAPLLFRRTVAHTCSLYNIRIASALISHACSGPCCLHSARATTISIRSARPSCKLLHPGPQGTTVPIIKRLRSRWGCEVALALGVSCAQMQHRPIPRLLHSLPERGCDSGRITPALGFCSPSMNRCSKHRTFMSSGRHRPGGPQGAVWATAFQVS